MQFAGNLTAATDRDKNDGGPNSGLNRGSSVNVPEELAALAAPNQDLSSVRLLDDGCYWYQYNGPVESTLLPLRSVDGRPICTSADLAAEAAA